jgi:hypothetical protein
MSAMMQSRFGRALYEALPEVYRTRDSREGEGHLAAYLDSCGELLDVIYNSLDQRYKDCVPDTCQEWLLPYFAELLGATTLSPHIEGRRKEIMHAVAWRQGKGTLRTIEEIARKIGGFENLLAQEGWQRVARTARVDGPFTSPAMVDLRKKNPEDFTGYRNTAPHFVDVRKLDWRQGHANPRAVLLYTSSYTGFFPGKNIVRFKWKTKRGNGSSDIDSWLTEENGLVLPSKFMELKEEGGIWRFSKKTGIKEPIQIGGEKHLGKAVQYHFTELNLDTVTIPTGTHLFLEKLAVRKIVVRNATVYTPRSSLVANDCLLQAVKASNGLVRLVYCTVLDEMFAEYLEASDCIFMETLFKNRHKKKPSPGGIRYSRHGQEDVFGNIVGNTTDVPVFYTKEWGEPGCGVIHPISPESVCHGAEDGGEMGAFHHRAYALAWEAVTRKLDDYIPIGMSAALIPDESLCNTN